MERSEPEGLPLLLDDIAAGFAGKLRAMVEELGCKPAVVVEVEEVVGKTGRVAGKELVVVEEAGKGLVGGRLTGQVVQVVGKPVVVEVEEEVGKQPVAEGRRPAVEVAWVEEPGRKSVAGQNTILGVQLVEEVVQVGKLQVEELEVVRAGKLEVVQVDKPELVEPEQKRPECKGLAEAICIVEEDCTVV